MPEHSVKMEWETYMHPNALEQAAMEGESPVALPGACILLGIDKTSNRSSSSRAA
jgi:hypothetical protein